jgi:hypothetical protein
MFKKDAIFNFIAWIVIIVLGLLGILFFPILPTCTPSVPEELKTNVLRHYKDDTELLKKYHFPYPFLVEKIKKEKVTKRDDIQKVIRGYEKYEVIEDKNRDLIIDRYTYNMVWYGKAYIEISYDKSNTMVRIDETGSALIILE